MSFGTPNSSLPLVYLVHALHRGSPYTKLMPKSIRSFGVGLASALAQSVSSPLPSVTGLHELTLTHL